MPRKRAGQHVHLDKAEKRRKVTPAKVVNVEDPHRRNPPSSSSAQSSTMEQLEKFVRAGNQAATRQLLSHEAINLKTSEGGDLLWTAYTLGRDEMLALLVHYEADLSVRKHVDKRTLLHHMLRGSRIASSATRSLFCLMLDFGADVDARDDKGKSLLHDAITSSQQGSTELAKELLKRGARITINRENPLMDDICLACEHKMELVPKLIQHEEPDEQTKDERVIIAIECLISKKYTGIQGEAALLMIENLLDLCMPVNVPLVPQHNKQQFSFLNTALRHQNKSVVELLLEYGEDPLQHDSIGNSTLYQATGFKGDTQISRWLIERGVSVQTRNYDGDYPIHGACMNGCVKNLHLLLNLGANLNCTDRFGQTPFGSMGICKHKNREVHDLVVKHFALTVASGGKLNKNDRAKINECTWSNNYFQRCLRQLERMKLEKVCNDISYFSLISKNMYSTLQLVKHKNFLDSFKRDELKLANLFPDYFYMLLHSFQVAKKKIEVLLAETQEVRNVFMGSIPDYIAEKIAYYLCFDKMVHCHNHYFMSFHAKNDFETKKKNCL